MNEFSMRKRAFFLRLTAFFSLLFCLIPLFFFTGCNTPIDYFEYVSEYRGNVLYATGENFDLKIYSTEREYPYAADGIKRETSHVTEVFFAAESGEKTYSVSFHYDGKSYGGECSYDAVKSRYYFSCAADLSNAQALAIELQSGETTYALNAVSVLTEQTLSGREIVQKTAEKEKDLFSSLTDNKRFFGEIYLRVLFEEKVYYYLGIVTESGKIHSFLLDGTTGNIIAKRQN